MREIDIPKMDFRTMYEKYKSLVMSFGQANATTTFMDLMNRMFWKFLQMFFIVLIADILVHSRIEDDHMNHLRIESKILKYYQVFANLNKSAFLLKSLSFLGHIVS